jgi:uncharacterized protein (DUF427 family)
MRQARVEPVGGQESVWDYPRPPALVRDERHVVVTFAGITIAETTRALRILETSHPPTFYLPLDDVGRDLLRPAEGASFCEWKGAAAYVDVVVGDRVAREAGWYYPDPSPTYRALRDHVAFYAGRVERCTVDGIAVTPQPGGFYGGWITPDVAGPFKGEPGTRSW